MSDDLNVLQEVRGEVICWLWGKREGLRVWKEWKEIRRITVENLIENQMNKRISEQSWGAEIKFQKFVVEPTGTSLTFSSNNWQWDNKSREDIWLDLPNSQDWHNSCKGLRWAEEPGLLVREWSWCSGESEKQMSQLKLEFSWRTKGTEEDIIQDKMQLKRFMSKASECGKGSMGKSNWTGLEGSASASVRLVSQKWKGQVMTARRVYILLVGFWRRIKQRFKVLQKRKKLKLIMLQKLPFVLLRLIMDKLEKNSMKKIWRY